MPAFLFFSLLYRTQEFSRTFRRFIFRPAGSAAIGTAAFFAVSLAAILLPRVVRLSRRAFIAVFAIAARTARPFRFISRVRFSFSIGFFVARIVESAQKEARILRFSHTPSASIIVALALKFVRFEPRFSTKIARTVRHTFVRFKLFLSFAILSSVF